MFELVWVSQLKYQAVHFYNEVSYVWETFPSYIVKKKPNTVVNEEQDDAKYRGRKQLVVVRLHLE